MAEDARARLVGQLELQAEAWDRFRYRPRFAYRGPWDFVLKHGRLELDVRRSPALGAPRSCYGNAIIQATMSQHAGLPVEYVEGYALTPYGLAVQHAWVRVADAWAFEVTWRVVGLAYLGVVFSVERADDATWNGDASVLDDHRRGWPVLQQPWLGEHGDVFPPSERLDLIRAAVVSGRRRQSESADGPSRQV